MTGWIAAGALARATGLSLTSVCRLKDLGSETRTNKEAGKRGRPRLEFRIETLPVTYQKKLLTARLAHAHRFDALALQEPNGQITLFAGGGDEDLREIIPDAEQRKQAADRLEILRPLDDFIRRKLSSFKTLDGREITNSDELAAYLGSSIGKSGRTIWRWYQAFTQGKKTKSGIIQGVAALAKTARSDEGTSRFFERFPKAAQLIEAKYLHERLSIEACYYALKREWGKPGVPYNHGSEPPSYSTVAYYLKRLPEPLKIMAREGEAEYTQKVAPYLVRRYTDIRVNQVWISDHCQHDVWVRNDGIFPGIERDAALRPWLSAWMDMRSRKLVGAVWFNNPSSYTAGSALRRGILENGLPDGVYLDNGKDYQKMGRHNDLAPEMDGVLRQLGVAITSALPYHPQSKPIESWFGNRLHERFDKLWTGFYCGGSPSERPEDCNENLAVHAKWLEGKAQKTPLPLASDFVALARQFIHEYNTELPHSGRGMDNRTPEEVFQALLPASERKTVSDPKALDVMFYERKERVVSEGGCVEMFSARFEPADAQSGANLFQWIGQRAVVAFDPANITEMIVLNSASNEVIGRVLSQKLIAQGPASHEDVKASMRKRTAAKSAINAYVKGIAYGVPSELDRLRASAGVAATIEGDVPGLANTRPDRGTRQLTSRASLATAPEYVDDVVGDVRKLMDGGD
jgi:hypothetical protein